MGELAGSDLPYHLRPDAPPLAECDRCSRKTWSVAEVGAQDRMTQPNGQPCGGRFVPTLAHLLCAKIASQQRSYDRILNDRSQSALSVQLGLSGQITGLRVALCLLLGWDPQQDADREGRADDLVWAWQDSQPDAPPDAKPGEVE